MKEKERIRTKPCGVQPKVTNLPSLGSPAMTASNVAAYWLRVPLYRYHCLCETRACSVVMDIFAMLLCLCLYSAEPTSTTRRTGKFVGRGVQNAKISKNFC